MSFGWRSAGMQNGTKTPSIWERRLGGNLRVQGEPMMRFRGREPCCRRWQRKGYRDETLRRHPRRLCSLRGREDSHSQGLPENQPLGFSADLPRHVGLRMRPISSNL